MEFNDKKFELQTYQACPNLISPQLPFHPELYSYIVSNSVRIDPKLQLRDLGITVTSDLSWSTHIASIASKKKGIMAWVLSVFSSREPTVMLTLYKSIVRSNIEYCCPLWHPSKIQDIEMLESIQRQFTRKVNGCQTLTYWKRLQKLRLSSLQRRRERYIVLTMWKILNNKIPNMNVQFRPQSRLGIQAVVPSLAPGSRAANRTIYEQSFAVIGPTLWNCLPCQLTTIECASSFKAKISALIYSLLDEPPVSGYMRAHGNSLPEAVRRADERWSRW